MTMIEQAREATRSMVFGELGVEAEYRPSTGSPVSLQVVFKPLGRADADYGDGRRASIDVMRDEISGRPEEGEVFFIESESPQTWRVTADDEGQSEGQTRFTWSVLCVGEAGRRLNPGRLERI